MSRRSFAVVTIIALALAPTRASAQAPMPAPSVGYDTVVLRDGNVLRGKIRELHPEREVIIVVAGEARTIAWQDLTSASFASAEGVGPAAVETAPSWPRIFIEAPSWAADLHLAEALEWPLAWYSRQAREVKYGRSRLVCRAPCGQVIDGSSGAPFFFGGRGLTPSRTLFLKDLEGEYVARVRPGRPALLPVGVLMATLGFGGTLGGGLWVGISDEQEPRTIGGVLIGLGIALLAAGVTTAIHGTTRYRLYRRR